MGIENVTARPDTDDPARLGGASAPVKPKKAKTSAKEAERLSKLHGKLMNWYLQERDVQAQNRIEMATDEDFYDGLQWSDEDAEELMERGQAPLVFNQVKPTINWMLGTERRTRMDYKVLPREESDEKGAEVKTKLLKYLSDVNRLPFTRSQAFKAQIVAGLGWMEDYITRDPSKELLASRFESWRFIYHDSRAMEMDLSDARYLFRFKWVDLDVAMAMCPDKASLLKGAAVDNEQITADDDDPYYLGSRISTSSGDWGSTRRHAASTYGTVMSGRERVKLIEAWYRVPTHCKVCRATDPEFAHLDGKEYNDADDIMRGAVEDGYVSVAAATLMKMRVALMTEGAMLYEGATPYHHDRFPFTPMWCYRRHRDNLPYGVIRDIRDAQIDYNKRASKALYILSTVRVIMDQDAVEDVDEMRREIARPDSIIRKKKNAHLEIDRDVSLADQHLKLMTFDGQTIRDVGGVTDQNLGKDDKGLSGQAIGKLQDQGSIVTAVLFDNMRLAIQMQGELQVSLTQQFYTARKVLRIVGDKQPIEWLPINHYDPALGEYINDITKTKADFVVGEQDFKQSIRQAMFDSMLELIAKLEPQVGLALLDMVIDFADVPNKEELVKRIRKINGQTDPSKKPDPEEQKRLDAAEAEQAEAAQIAKDTAKADLDKKVAEADKARAQTKQILQQAIQVGVQAAYEALQGAQILSAVPNAAPVADALLAGAGYVDQNGQDPNIPTVAGAAPALPAPNQAPADMAPPPELQQADGAAAGIETMTPQDNLQPPPQE